MTDEVTALLGYFDRAEGQGLLAKYPRLRAHVEDLRAAEAGWQDENRTYTPNERQLDTRIDAKPERREAAPPPANELVEYVCTVCGEVADAPTNEEWNPPQDEEEPAPKSRLRDIPF